MPAPLHVLLTGQPEGDWDRRLIVKNAPGLRHPGEPVTLTLRVEDQGAVPAGRGRRGRPVDRHRRRRAAWSSASGGRGSGTARHAAPWRHERAAVPGGPVEGELTDRNNAAVVQINGVRDRLRVLLVSGEPHAGERVWRNLLKSDPSVDLVHFTILRPPEKQDGVPVTELS
jgi:hypothetical protein